MQELLIYIRIIKDIIDSNYDKEMVFYDNGKWYSREHGRNITLEELSDWVRQLTYSEECGVGFDDFSDTLPCGCCACCGCSCDDEDYDGYHEDDFNEWDFM